jgi:two-component system LytT family response regulator
MQTRLDPTCFLRIHRSTLVNLARIRELQRLEDGGALLVLDSGVHLRVARNRRGAVERALVGVTD